MADDIQRLRPPPNRRRDKVQLSCDVCRQRKLRCDRQQPCGACSKRGNTDSCNYATPTSSPSSATHAQRSNPAGLPNSFQNRIAELEDLVVTLIEGQSLPTPTEPRSPVRGTVASAEGIPGISGQQRSRDDGLSPADPGTLNLHGSGSSYVQSIHWEAILTKIRGLQKDSVTDYNFYPGSQLFYGPNRQVSRSEILAAVPTRQVVDRLMALHFDSYMITPYLIHRKKFLREYEAFWEDPFSISIAWIGLMFSMLCVASQLQTFTIDPLDSRAKSLETEYLTMRDAFREKAVQCLVSTRYTTGGPYILETLVMILTGESVLLKNSASDGWLSASMILHIAIRMGYHRDPSHFPGISLFESEMRRRIWSIIVVLDIALSIEKGLPRSAVTAHADTKLPSNLKDSDFDEDMIELPGSTPETEWTPILPLIAKGKLVSVLGLICDVNTDIAAPSHDELAKIDALLEDVHNDSIPSILRWSDTPHPITDSPELLMHRISIETSYYKSRILLHRRALTSHPARQERESARICIDSALQILSFQQLLHEESQSLGRLSQLKWKVIHIFNQDVLLATSILCLHLQETDKFEPSEAAPLSYRIEETRERLTVSHKIWLGMSSVSAEAGKVAKALSVVLGNSQPTAQEYDGPTSHGFLADPDVMFTTLDFPYNFYSPLSVFDNVLESHRL